MNDEGNDASNTPTSLVGILNRLASHKSAIKEIQDLVNQSDSELAKEIVVILKRNGVLMNDKQVENDEASN